MVFGTYRLSDAKSTAAAAMTNPASTPESMESSDAAPGLEKARRKDVRS